MIHSITFENFYSFKEETVIDFRVSDKFDKTDWYFNAPSGQKLSKLLTVIGPNGSGKTNILRALSFTKWLMIDSYALPNDMRIPFQPYLFGNSAELPTKIAVTFEIAGDIYTYSFVLDTIKIISEELVVRSKTKVKSTLKTKFKRTWDEEQEKYVLVADQFDLPKGFEANLRKTSSILSITSNHAESSKIIDYWKNFQTEVAEVGRISEFTGQQEFFHALDFFSTNTELKLIAERIISKLDIGLDKIIIKREQVNPQQINFNATGRHQYNSGSFKLPVTYESSGTRRLFVLLRSILNALQNGGLVVYDEFETSLHPDMIEPLFDLFVQKDTNPHNAQIIVSTHSHQILSDLDKFQIILVEKNRDGFSEAWRLDEMPEVRADDNYYRKYIAGAYGAKPNI